MEKKMCAIYRQLREGEASEARAEPAGKSKLASPPPCRRSPGTRLDAARSISSVGRHPGGRRYEKYRGGDGAAVEQIPRKTVARQQEDTFVFLRK